MASSLFGRVLMILETVESVGGGLRHKLCVARLQKRSRYTSWLRQVPRLQSPGHFSDAPVPRLKAPPRVLAIDVGLVYHFYQTAVSPVRKEDPIMKPVAKLLLLVAALSAFIQVSATNAAQATEACCSKDGGVCCTGCTGICERDALYCYCW